MIDLEQLKRDREAGTPGPWLQGFQIDDVSKHNHYDPFGPDRTNIACVVGYQEGSEDASPESIADAHRIARVPDLEAMVLEQADEITRLRADLAAAREQVAGAWMAAATGLIWEDTRNVVFDGTMMFSKGYDFDCLDFREESETAEGRYVVWKCSAHGWSAYGGKLGLHMFGFPDEASAKDAVRSVHIRALTPSDATAALEAHDERVRAEERAKVIEEAAAKMDAGWSYIAGNAIRALHTETSREVK